jgi:hypothetical protein
MSPATFYLACIAWCVLVWALVIWFVATALAVLS